MPRPPAVAAPPSPRPEPCVSRAARTVPDVLAAVDLGSNSFHLVVARYSHGQLVVIDRLREMVCLAAGVGPDGRLDKQVAARALACLERFGQRLRDMHARSVRVVGTNALRISRRKQAFLERARDPQGSGVTAAGLARLLDDLARAGNCRELGFESLTDERRPVFPGGVVILGELFEALGIEQLRMADGALRDGLLYDMIGRLTDEDPRERTVSSMFKRYQA